MSNARNISKAESRFVNATGDTMSGDFTVDIDTFHVSTTGNSIGIGTSSPQRRVHLGGSGNRQYFLAETTDSGSGDEAGFRLKTPSAEWQLYSKGDSQDLVFRDAVGSAERLRMNATGGITTPSQPGFHARLHTNPKTLSGSAWAATTGGDWDWRTSSGGYNTGTNWNPSANRFTAPVTGKYYFYAVFYTNTSGNSFRFSASNGSLYYHGSISDGSNVSSTDTNAVIPLSAGDYVDLQVGYNPSGDIAGSISGFSRTRWGCHLLG